LTQESCDGTTFINLPDNKKIVPATIREFRMIGSMYGELSDAPEELRDDFSGLQITVPAAPAVVHPWKENEESNTVRPKTLVDLQTDRLGAPDSHQERRQSHCKVQQNRSR
jgi:hypothetical protein